MESTTVDPEVKAFYDQAYAIYRQLYQDLRGSFREMSELVARQHQGLKSRQALEAA